LSLVELEVSSRIILGMSLVQIATLTTILPEVYRSYNEVKLVQITGIRRSEKGPGPNYGDYIFVSLGCITVCQL